MIEANSVHSTPTLNSSSIQEDNLRLPGDRPDERPAGESRKPAEGLSNVVRLPPAYDDDTDDDCLAIIQYAELLCIISASGDLDGVDMPAGVNRLLWVISDHAKAIQALNSGARGRLEG